jgi:signal transduction histidine kinase
LSPALHHRLRQEADWALRALGAAGIAIFARTADDTLEPLESRGALAAAHVQALAQQGRGWLLAGIWEPLALESLAGAEIPSAVTLPPTPASADPAAFTVLCGAGMRAVLAVALGDEETGTGEEVGAALGGVLLVAWRAPDPQIDRALLSRIAAHMGLALAYTRQHVHLDHARRFSALMRQATDAIQQHMLDDPEAVVPPHLHTILAHAATVLDAQAGAIALLQGDGATICYAAVHNLPRELVGTCAPAREGLIWRALQTGRPVLLDEEHSLHSPGSSGSVGGAHTLGAASPAPIWIAAPITARGVVWGVLCLAAKSPRHVTSWDSAIVTLFARFCAASLTVRQLYERGQQAAALEQRYALARELHDSVMQTMFSLQLAAQSALDTWEAQPAQARAALEMVLHLALGAGAELRSLLFELRGTALESEGLARALERYVDLVRHRSALTIALHLSQLPRLPVTYEETLYRVAQEALTNVARHARAAHASIALTADADRACLSVEDDGIGFATAAPALGSSGLSAMRERVSALGGTLRLGNRPEGGAYVHADVPLPAGTL